MASRRVRWQPARGDASRAGATVVYGLINRLASNPPRVWLIAVLIGFVLTALPNLALAANPAALQQAAAAAKAQGRPDAVARLADLVDEMTRGK